MIQCIVGIGKRFVKDGLIANNILNTQLLKQLQSTINLISVPYTVGRIPHKIESQFGSLTADEYKNWTNLFSLLALWDILPPDSKQYLECWRLFVIACRLLSKKSLTQIDIQTGDALLVSFCQKVELLFGNGFITPNMHIACHLHECIQDYGPMHGFWLFSFERCNGILENQPFNNRSIEVQLMRRFLQDGFFLTIKHFVDTFQPVYDVVSVFDVGSVSDTLTLEDFHSLKLAKTYSRCCFDGDDLSRLTKIYTKLFPDSHDKIFVSSTYKLYKFIVLDNHRLYSCANLLKPSIFLATWNVWFSHR